MNAADVPVLSPVSERKCRTRCTAYANYAITRWLYTHRQSNGFADKKHLILDDIFLTVTVLGER